MEKRQTVEVTLDTMIVKIEADSTNLPELESMRRVLDYYEEVGIPLDHYRERYKELKVIVDRNTAW